MQPARMHGVLWGDRATCSMLFKPGRLGTCCLWCQSSVVAAAELCWGRNALDRRACPLYWTGCMHAVTYVTGRVFKWAGYTLKAVHGSCMHDMCLAGDRGQHNPNCLPHNKNKSTHAT